MTAHSPEGSADWLADAVIYEIYPQSFADSNGDGIGDFPGVIAHLDHLQWLGRQHDLVQPVLRVAVRRRGLRRVRLPAGGAAVRHQRRPGPAGRGGPRARDPGAARPRRRSHVASSTSGSRPSCTPTGRTPRATATSGPTGTTGGGSTQGAPGGSPWVPSPGPRPGYYLKNFYDEQPALNFGYAELRRRASRGASRSDAPGPQRNVQALRDIMAFWLDRGVAGFRVDMAFSLVKDDPGYVSDARALARAAGLARRDLSRGRPDPRGGRAARRPPDVVRRRLLPRHPPRARARCSTTAGRARCRGTPRLRASSTPRARARPGPSWRSSPTRGSNRPGRDVILATADHDFSRLACGAARRGAARRGVHVPADVGHGAVDLLRRRDRHALPAGPAGHGGQHRPPGVQPGRGPHADAVGRLRRRGLLDRAARAASTCRSTRLRTGPTSRPSWPTRARPCTWYAGCSRCARRRRRWARGRRPLCCTRTTRSSTCAAARTWSSSIPGASRWRPQVTGLPGLSGATSLLGRGVTVGAGAVRSEGFGYGIFELAGA